METVAIPRLIQLAASLYRCNKRQQKGGKIVKKTIVFFLIVVMTLVLCGCGKSAEAKLAEEYILTIGEVTLDSEEAIVVAEEAYNMLSEQEKEQIIDSAQVLSEARTIYDKLVIENTDYVEELRKYIIDNGLYDFEEERHYIEKQIAGNIWYYLFAEEKGVSFFSACSYTGADHMFGDYYECTLKDYGGRFEITSMSIDTSRGYNDYGKAICGIGTVELDKQRVVFSDLTMNEADEEECKEYVWEKHQEAVAFVEDVLEEAQIGVLTYEELFK